LDFPFFQPLDLFSIRETYNSVQLFATLVNESKSLLKNRNAEASKVCSGRELRSLTNNRLFKLRGGPVYFHPDGSHHSNLVLYTFNQKTKRMQLAATYDSSTKTFTWNFNVTIFEWLKNGPPSDIPVCGFNDSEGPCSQKGWKYLFQFLAEFSNRI
jgi:hypothetical protein